MTRRKPGQGTIRTLGSGRFQVGLTTADGQRVWLDPVDTREEAEGIRNAAIARLADTTIAPVGGVTFGAYAARVLDRRELAGFDSDTYRYSLKRIEPFADWYHRPIRSLTARDVRMTFDALDRKFGRNTARSSLTAVRVVCAEAVRDELVEESPARTYQWPKRKGPKQAEILYFGAEQIEALRAEMTSEQRCFFDFALGTGLRVSEQIALRREDVHLEGDAPFVHVRFGGPPSRPTKSGEERRVPLFGPALAAAREWVREHLPKRPNPKRLMFPTVTGCFMDRSHPIGARIGANAAGRMVSLCLWSEIRARVGIGRGYVWHSLRHTTATWLLSGHFGHRWSIEQVKTLLGHADIKTTQVYAEMTDDALHAVAAITRRSRPEDDEATAPQESQAKVPVARAHRQQIGSIGPMPEWIRELATARDQFVIAASAKSPEAGRLARQLAQAVMASAPMRAAMAVLADDGTHVVSRGLDLAESIEALDVGEEQREARKA